MATVIQIRRDTAANWTSVNPVLADGELGVETDTKKFKLGNGSATWTALSYVSSGNVESVNGQTGVVELDAEDVGALPDSTVIPTDTADLTNGAGFITSSALTGYELKATIQTLSATDSITLADNTIYNGGEQTALTIALPATDTIGFICDVDFSSGNTATTLSYSLPDIFWEGVDVAYDSTAQKNIFTPVANKRYTIVFYYDGVNYNGRVGGV